MKMFKTIAAFLAALAVPAVAQPPSDLKPTVQTAQKLGTAIPLSPGARPGAQLTKADVDAWLDGYVPYALSTGDIAGAVVVVVKDGQVLTQRGFGYSNVKTRAPVDPAATLFRPGSISKLFTWTAVMQLVQAGKIDLDRDVNDYLDFRIPPAFGKPITMRNLMTHTAGFEETAKYLIVFDPKQNPPLKRVMSRSIPPRIYAPGAMTAYSNYGASLAGYIVERVSGEAFDDYIQRHILVPLAMDHSSFAQPLPPALRANLSQGYQQASRKAEPFEIIGLAPAGALSATGADMARFMMAHLSNGGPLLNPQTAQLMHSAANTPIPGLPSMALGFYQEDRNGRHIIGHGGDTNFFHSDLHLFMDDGVGLFLSFNSGGKEGAAHIAREQLFESFVDRYFPQAPRPLPTATTAHDHGSVMAGNYMSSRRSDSSFLRFLTLISQTKVALNDDNTITVSDLRDPAGTPKKWREIGPWLWQEVGGSDRLGALVANGKVVRFAPAGFAPIIEFVPVPASYNAAWILPLATLALIIMALTALSWPAVAMIRRSYRYNAGVTGRPLLLHRASRITAWLAVIIVVGWLLIITTLTNDVAAFDGRLDIWMRLLQLLLLAAIVGTLLSIWNAYVALTTPGRTRFAKIWSVLVALSALFLVWVALAGRLLTWGLNF